MKLNKLSDAEIFGSFSSLYKIQKILLFSVLFLFLLNGFSYSFSNQKFGKNTNQFQFSEEQKIFQLINDERFRKGLEPLVWNSKLAEIARNFSQKMAKEKFFDHFDRDRKSIVDRVKEKKVKNWRRLGENLFMSEGFENFARTAVRGWMKSPTHRSNILDFNFEETGIGIAFARDGTIYITQVFMQNL